MEQQTPRDRIYPETRVAAGFIVFILAGGFVLLWLFPNDTERLWAWAIRPALTPLVMGSGYVSGVYFFGRTIFAPRWHWVGLGFLPVSLFTWFMGIATFLHWDRFNHGHPAFWIWTGAYVLTPILVPLLWWRNRGEDPGTPDPDDVVVPKVIRMGMGLVGAAILLLAVVMFIAPDLLIPVWPWRLTPLTTRVLAGWIALAGALGVAVWTESRWSAVRLPIHTGAIAAGFAFVGFIRAWEDFSAANPATWLAVGYVGLTVVFLVGLSIVMDQQRRQQAVRGDSVAAP
jgi:hypothetical protein